MENLTRVLLCACALALFCQCMTEGDGDGCTHGFMSLDRMDRLLGNIGTRAVANNFQVIFPEVGFACNGSIQSWMFGARWEGHDEFIELQIWRPTGNWAYTKVGNTTINTASSDSELYEYPLSPPLAFQAGDVLGYYQPDPSRSQLKLLLVQDGRENQVGYLYSRTGPANLLNINLGSRSSTFQLFVNVVTDPPGCGRGFMSVERMRLSLNLDSVSLPIVYTSQRQQVSPEMRFTCDGNITKWIIGADYGLNVNFYPELQIWRKAGDETYEKISGTFIEAPTLVNTRIYEYNNFSPIPVKSGDILGIFLPRGFFSRLRLLSEDTNTPTQYYRFTDTFARVSPYNVFDIGYQFVRTSSYHPLVSVEFVRSPTSSVMILSSSSLASMATLHPSSPLASIISQGPLLVPTPTTETLPISSGTFQSSSLALTAETVPSSSLVSTATSPLPTSIPSTDQPSSSSSGQSSAAIAAGVGGGVAVALVLLIVAVLLVILVVFVVRRKPKAKPQAVEKEQDRNGDSAMDNPVYTGVVSGAGPTTATIPLEELYDLPGRDEGRGEGVYDLPSENGGVYSEVPRTEEPPPSPGEYAKFDNPLYDTT